MIKKVAYIIMKIKLLFFVACLVALSGCGVKSEPAEPLDQINEEVSDSLWVEDAYYIHYDELIEGYDVTVKVLRSCPIWNLSYQAVIQFRTDSSYFQVVHDGWFDTLSKDYPSDTVITCHYRKPKNPNAKVIRLGEYSEENFFFLDVDFNGNKEIVCSLYGQGQKWATAYKAISVKYDYLYDNLKEKPFTEFDDYTIIDYNTLTIKNFHLCSGFQTIVSYFVYEPQNSFGPALLKEHYDLDYDDYDYNTQTANLKKIVYTTKEERKGKAVMDEW